jgi:hypothetical protein
MAKIVRRRRGTTTQHANFTGDPGEITVDLTEKTVRVHIGDNFEGGYPLARKDMSNVVDKVGITQLKVTDGTPDQLLSTDGNGNLQFSNAPDVSGASVGGDISGTVGNAQIVANAVGTPEIADNAVVSTKIPAGNIEQTHLAVNSVGTSQIQLNAVTVSEIAPMAVQEAKIQTGAVTANKIADNAVTTAKILDANVTTNKLVDNVVTTVKILNANVTDVKLATNSVTTTKIVDGNVTVAKLASSGVLPALDGSNLINLTIPEGVPSGVIAIWSQSIATIPSGWVICDGNNGTPDLRDSFVFGAGSGQAVGTTGGSTSTAGATLSIAQLAAHTHTYQNNPARSQGGDNAVQSALQSAATTSSTGSGASHTHTGTLPPFVALAYIMKT